MYSPLVSVFLALEDDDALPLNACSFWSRFSLWPCWSELGRRIRKYFYIMKESSSYLLRITSHSVELSRHCPSWLSASPCFVADTETFPSLLIGLLCYRKSSSRRTKGILRTTTRHSAPSVPARVHFTLETTTMLMWMRNCTSVSRDGKVWLQAQRLNRQLKMLIWAIQLRCDQYLMAYSAFISASVYFQPTIPASCLDA